MFCYLASLGFTFPNSPALALAAHGERAGSASAPFGTLQYSAAIVSSVVVARLRDGTPWPMAAVMTGCGALAWCARRFVVPAGRREPHLSVVEPVD